jgi:predicted nicotinamide N-methyase
MAGWYMENIIGKDKMAGSSLIELGAGVGFTSLIANALGASEVVITDGNTDVLKIADVNIKVNAPESDQSNLRTAQLRWNTEDESSFKIGKNGRPWDYIVAADVTYLKKNRVDLITSIATLSGPNTITMISMEPRNVGEVEDVIKIVESQGLSWKEEHLPIDKEKSQCNLMCARMFLLSKNPSVLKPSATM